MPEWDRQNRGRSQKNRYSTSYGDDKQEDGDYDGKSCSDFHQLPGRGIADVEDLTMLSGLRDYDTDEESDRKD